MQKADASTVHDLAITELFDGDKNKNKNNKEQDMEKET